MIEVAVKGRYFGMLMLYDFTKEIDKQSQLQNSLMSTAGE